MGAAAAMQAEEARNNRNQGARLPRPQLEEALMCPRCGSSNTKFCYYNNNNMSQPRYRCRNCVRTWTQGGSLRDVPVGGGGRKKKSKRSSLAQSSSASSSSISKERLVVPAASSSMTTTAEQQDVLMPAAAVGFELPGSQQPLSFLPDFGLAHPTAGGAEASSFLDMLTGDFDYQQIVSQGFYDPVVSSGMDAPPLVFGGGAPVGGGGGEDSTAASTHLQGVQCPASSQVGANDEKEEGASAPHNARG
jgi:hypothetical protein